MTPYLTTLEAVSLESAYQAAKLRLQAAQQEKLEASAEFLSARAALGQRMEMLWPVPCQCGETTQHT